MGFEVLTESKPQERRLNQDEVVELAKTCRIATPKEADKYVMKNGGAFWTSVWMEYTAGATTAKVWTLHDGKKSVVEIPLPLKDGYYLPDPVFGIPNGKPSDSSDKNARYLWRSQSDSFSGLVARYFGGFDVRRGVGCDDDPSTRDGVLVRKNE